MSRGKLEFILSLINDIDYIVAKHQNVTQALRDREGKHALLMCLLQIGETLNKVKTSNSTLLEYAKGAYNVRNFIAHDYEGVNLAIIEHVIRNLLNPLKDEILHEFSNP